MSSLLVQIDVLLYRGSLTLFGGRLFSLSFICCIVLLEDGEVSTSVRGITGFSTPPPSHSLCLKATAALRIPANAEPRLVVTGSGAENVGRPERRIVAAIGGLVVSGVASERAATLTMLASSARWTTCQHDSNVFYQAITVYC